MLWITSGILISYLIGSIPTAYIFGRLFKGVDIRNFGSGNVGATNTYRVLGRAPAVIVLSLDALKGFASVIFIGDMLAPRINAVSIETLRIILGLSCICGHNWTLFLRFKGGKGVATTLGVLAGLSLKISGLKFILGLTILSWFAVFSIFRIVSLASCCVAVCFPLYVFLFRQSSALKITSVILACFILLRHKSNLKKILQGKEKKLF